MAKQRVIAILGPTSSGKSALAVEIAKEFGGEIISADARQVYRGLNIGTGKITHPEMHSISHHLLDVADPKRIFTAHDFIQQGQGALLEISKRGNIPVVCGGSGFYIDALLGRIVLADVAANPKLRAVLEKKTTAQLFALLKKQDPRRAKAIDPHNKRRLVRALEIAVQLGKNPRPTKRKQYEMLWIGLQPTSAELRERINKRLSVRLKHGMIAEAKRLHARGLSYKRMEELGLEYRSLARFLQCKITRAELEIELQHAIWQYAKRQITYWRRNTEINWFDPKDISGVQRAVATFLTH
jgi:tRNA dimethylallyltransferase